MDNTESILQQSAKLLQQADPTIDYYDAIERIRKQTGFSSGEDGVRDPDYRRLSWDSYFMSLAFLVAMRSPDAQTAHGSVIVDTNKRIVSTGYNGFLQGAPDQLMPNLRPKKYQMVLHSELNAILSSKQDLTGCTIYITGLPCNDCLKVIVQSGIRDIIVGDRNHVFADGYLELQSFICACHGVKITKFAGFLANLDGRQIK